MFITVKVATQLTTVRHDLIPPGHRLTLDPERPRLTVLGATVSRRIAPIVIAAITAMSGAGTIMAVTAVTAAPAGASVIAAAPSTHYEW